DAGPDGPARRPGDDSPLSRERADDVKTAAAGRVGGRSHPGAAGVFDLDADAGPGSALGADGEGPPGLAGVTVTGRVGGKLRDAEDHIVGDGATVEQPPHVGPDLADAVRLTGVGVR